MPMSPRKYNNSMITLNNCSINCSTSAYLPGSVTISNSNSTSAFQIYSGSTSTSAYNINSNNGSGINWNYGNYIILDKDYKADEIVEMIKEIGKDKKELIYSLRDEDDDKVKIAKALLEFLKTWND